MFKKVNISFLLLTLCLSAAFIATAEEDGMCQVGKDADRAVLLVEKAKQYVAEHGAEAAVKAFHDPKSEFHDGELYILFYAFDGTCIANGFKPEFAGLNRFNVQDVDGLYSVQAMIKLASGDGGWVNYKFDNPVTKKVEQKSTYVKQAPGMDAFVGCGIYGLPK